MVAAKTLVLSYRASKLTVAFDGPASLTVDLSKVKMTARQAEIVEKLLRSKPSITLEECVGETCPAQRVLTADEFRSIRQLKATLGSVGPLAATACDFCLKCVKLEAIPTPNG